jgi:hypothetical protein
LKTLGNSRAYPQVYDFFPKLGRGHAGKNCLSCKTGDMKNHSNQAQNRKDWEESVGIRRGSRGTRNAVRAQSTAAVAALDPKDFASLPATK